MKVVAINSSPNMGKGNTALILDPFLEGMMETGADVELFFTRKLKIKPCRGEFHCWVRTPGECYRQDDMQMLLPKIAEADIVVLATPVYVDGVTGPMKNLMDRLLPLLHPYFELRDGHSRHQLRDKSNPGRLVLVSNCGFWEMDNFDPLLTQMAAVCKNLKMEFAGALLRPHGPALNAMQEMGMPVEDIFESAKAAGHQLVKYGRISSEALTAVSRELLPLDMYMEIGNQKFQELLELLEEEWAQVKRFHGNEIQAPNIFKDMGKDNFY